MFKVLGSDQQVYGPVTAGQLRQWMSEGRVHPATLVLAEGAAEWKPLSSWAEFAVPPVVSLPQSPARTEGNDMALWSMICGILANLCCCASTIFGVLGLIFSIMVLSRRQDYPGENHRQMAVAGLILSIIGLLWHCLLPLFFFVPRGWGLHHFRGWRM
jgi:undecaprenyl pyrophosphate phosphatase UppP